MVKRWLLGPAICALFITVAPPLTTPVSAIPPSLEPGIGRPSGGGRSTADFNGDGFADLAIGAPLDDVEGAEDAGSVNVLYGSATGLTPAGAQFWTQGPTAAGDTPELADLFGASLAGGDFDGDGFDDLAIGAPLEADERFLGDPRTGTVNVLFGSPSGLASPSQQLWPETACGDFPLFGFSIAAANFGGPGPADDVAVGIPGCAGGWGAVEIFPGSRGGLPVLPSMVLGQGFGIPGGDIKGVAEEGDRFGYSLAAGDLGHDGRADLAIGVPFEDRGADLGPGDSAGAVNVIYGSASGLTASGNQLWTQDTASVLGATDASDFFGYALAIGNFGRACVGDLAIGVPGEQSAAHDAGAVNVLYSNCLQALPGLSPSGNQLWSQDTPGIPDTAESGDAFGSALAAGDVGRSTYADLAIGVPGEDIGGSADVGAVSVIYGTATGLGSTGNQRWAQGVAGVGDVGETGDGFGTALSIGDLGKACRADLAIGAPWEDVGRVVDAGSINLLYSACRARSAALAAGGNQIWNRGVRGVVGGLGSGDSFGSALGG